MRPAPPRPPAPQASLPPWDPRYPVARRRTSRSLSSSALPVAVFAVELLLAVSRREQGDQLVQLAGQDPVELVEGGVDAVVGDPVLLEVVGPDLVRAVPAAHHGAPLGVLGGVLLRQLALVEPGAEHAKRLLAVLQLRLLVLD